MYFVAIQAPASSAFERLPPSLTYVKFISMSLKRGRTFEIVGIDLFKTSRLTSLSNSTDENQVPVLLRDLAPNDFPDLFAAHLRAQNVDGNSMNLNASEVEATARRGRASGIGTVYKQG